MSLSRWIAAQLSQPSGFVGYLVMGPLWNRRNRALNDAAFDAMALSSRDRVLEVGFGGGYLLRRMSAVVVDGHLAGVDASMAVVRSCRRRYRSLVHKSALELSCARAESLPYPAGCFNKACSVNSIMYWQDASRAIAEFGRVLAGRGHLVLCFTCQKSLASRGFARHGLNAYEDTEVQAMMEQAGFGGIQTTLSSDQHREFLCMSGRKGPAPG